MHHSFSLGPVPLQARASGALFWPDQALLCVSDLHLGRSERMARRAGTLLPPYETRDTLARLEAEIEATGARRVVCLGDSFDDLAAEGGLDEADRLWLTRLIAGRDWVWIEGNHDAGPLEIAGSHRTELALDGLTFRHIAKPGAEGGEVSGHYHPKLTLAGTAFRCFLTDARRLILPAFGTYTGGLPAADAVFDSLLDSGALALLCGQTLRVVPRLRASTRGR